MSNALKKSLVASAARSARQAPGFVEPMKALATDAIPTGLWRCEIKFDGYRALAVLHDGAVSLWSRNRKPLGDYYPELIAPLAALNCTNAILDGEIVALDDQGRSRFQLLQGRELGKRPNLAYFVFDVVHLDGKTLVGLPLEERQKILAKLLKKAKAPVRLSPVFEVEPAELMQAARDQGLEGIIAKRPGSLYEVGRRGGAWLKCKVVGEQEFVIGGFTPPQGSRSYFGALLIGYYERGKLLYAGKVGTGFDRRRLESLHAELLLIARADCPFDNLPMDRRSRFGTGMTRGEMKKVTWVKPQLVAQIKFAEWTDDGILRQPVFLGLRTDKKAKDVRREAGAVGANRSEADQP